MWKCGISRTREADKNLSSSSAGVASATAWLAVVRCRRLGLRGTPFVSGECANLCEWQETCRGQLATNRSLKHVKVAAEWEEPDTRGVTVLKEPLCRWFIQAGDMLRGAEVIRGTQRFNQAATTGHWGTQSNRRGPHSEVGLDFKNHWLGW